MKTIKSPQMRKQTAVLALLLVTTTTMIGCGSGSSGGDTLQPSPIVEAPGSTTPPPQEGGGGFPPASPSPSPSAPGTGAYQPKGLNNKVFRVGTKTYAPMDMQAQSLTMTLDAAAGSATGTALINFSQKETSRPVFLLDATVKSLKLNGETVSAAKVQDPDKQNNFVVVDREIEKGKEAVLEVTYTLPTGRVSFTSGGVGFLTDMTDLMGRFFERWGPAGFEDDLFVLNLRLVVKNSKSKHQLFANGDAQQISPSEWLVKFPAHYNSSSFFVHLTNRNLVVNRFNYQGRERSIPITVYSASASNVDQASRQLPRLFAELEADYGPYMHPGFIAYIGSTSGGMEYVGATITSLRSLGHELTHSWFARGVMPAEGRSGWIDEAVASWRDNGYPRARSLLGRASTNLARYSPYMRSTPRNSYADGRALLGEWDLLLADRGGMKAVLREIFARYKGKLFTTEELRSVVQELSGGSVDSYFTRYVFGGHDVHLTDVDSMMAMENSDHPTTLTDDELEGLR